MKYEFLFSLFDKITEKNGTKTALGMRSKWGWSEFTYKGLNLLAMRLGAYLINDLKLEKGERLTILSESKPEYAACVFGSVLAGLTTVPLDNKLTIYELESILSNCEPSIMLCSSANIQKALTLREKIPSLKHIILMDADLLDNNEIPSIYSIPENYKAKWRRSSLNSTALIIYTSGTTGAPKGVQTTYKNVLTQMYDIKDVFKEIMPKKDVRLLSILPMNHLFEFTVGFVAMLNHGYSIYYTKSLKPKDIIETMKEKKISFMITVPAFLKLIKTSVEADLRKRPKFNQLLFKLRYEFARFLPLKARRIWFKSVHKMLGGRFYGCISGGAPLDEAVGEFFERIGIGVYQGYGLSETSPVISLCMNGKYHDIKSVGPILKSYEAKIDPNTGELLVKGPSVMKGYYKQEELTKTVITEDGWLHTGDMAEIKNDLLYITGRIKNMIVLSGGKKVFPEEVENVLGDSPNFAEVCVMGMAREFGEKDGCEEIVTVIVPNEDFANKYSDDKELEKAVRAEVKALSARLASYKRPVKIIVRRDSLPKTTTNKLKRKEIKELIKS